MTGPEAKSFPFLPVSGASQTAQTEDHESLVYSGTALKFGEEYIGREEGLPPVQLAQGSALPFLMS